MQKILSLRLCAALAVLAIAGALFATPSLAQTSSDVAERNQLIAAQENLLNAYRCLFAVDTDEVAGGCESPEVITAEAAPESPTAQDIESLDAQVQSHEALLNSFRCRFAVDTELVPDGCLDRSRATSEVRTQEDGSLLVYTDIVIEATPAQVWEVLTDFESMPDWSSSFQGITGDVSDGGQATAIYLNEGAPQEFPHVLSWEEGRSFSWSDPLAFAPGIVDDHHFTVDRTDGSATLFVQTDQFTGDSTVFPASTLADLLSGAYAQFNQELKAEVERRF